MSISKLKRAARGAVVVAAMLPAVEAQADEGGASFWVPGFFGMGPTNRHLR